VTAVRASTGTSRAHLPEVESLRGLAIALVLALHTDNLLHHPPLGIATPSPENTHVTVPLAVAFVRSGSTGVTLFFVLSGFLLSLPFLGATRGGQPVDWRRYARRRALRILPAYWVAVVAATLLSAQAPSDLLAGAPYLVFLNGAWPVRGLPPYSGVWWSLATEVQFYLALPVVAAVLATRSGLRLGAVMLASWGVAYAAYLAGVSPVRSIVGSMLLGLSLFGRAPAFLVGAGVAWVWVRHSGALRTLTSRLPTGLGDVVLLALLLLLGLLLQWAEFHNHWLVEAPPWHAWHVPEAALWGAVLLVLLGFPLAFRPLVDNPPLRWLGTISYSLYLVHFPVLAFGFAALRARWWPHLTTWNPAAAVASAGLLALCLLLATFTYRVIERPFLMAKSRVAT
jgi:peptidoglycan/LPS O-acetylase OafA/YrhL